MAFLTIERGRPGFRGRLPGIPSPLERLGPGAAGALINQAEENATGRGSIAPPPPPGAWKYATLAKYLLIGGAAAGGAALLVVLFKRRRK